MKVTVNIDCTPEEARRFMGLPDVAPMQEEMMTYIRERMMSNLQSMEPETFVKTWLPMSVQGFEQIQKLFWQQMSGMAQGAGKSDEDKEGGGN
jgi:hypothetical protein